MSEGGFPQSLLQQPVEARMAYFRSFTIAHPRLKEADTALKHAIQDSRRMVLDLRLRAHWRWQDDPAPPG